MHALEFCGFMWRQRRESGLFTPKQLLDEAQELLGHAASYVPDTPNFAGQLNADEQLSQSKLFRDYHKWNNRRSK